MKYCIILVEGIEAKQSEESIFIEHRGSNYFYICVFLVCFYLHKAHFCMLVLIIAQLSLDLRALTGSKPC